MFSLRQKVILWAIYSRVFILFIQVSHIFLYLIFNLTYYSLFTFQFFVNVALKQTEHIPIEQREEQNFTFQWVQVNSSPQSEQQIDTLNISDGNFKIIYLP